MDGGSRVNYSEWKRRKACKTRLDLGSFIPEPVIYSLQCMPSMPREIDSPGETQSAHTYNPKDVFFPPAENSASDFCLLVKNIRLDTGRLLVMQPSLKQCSQHLTSCAHVSWPGNNSVEKAGLVCSTNRPLLPLKAPIGPWFKSDIKEVM